MRGYLNYFETECNFIADTAYTIKGGSAVLVCSGELEGKEAVFQKENGEVFLETEDAKVSKLQGIILEIDESNLKKRYEEGSEKE